MSKYAIEKTTLDNLANAVRYRAGVTGTLSPADMIEELNKPYGCNSSINVFEDEPDEWVRPEDWPDLDSLNLEFTGDESFVYMTYDVSQENSAIAWHIETTSGQYTVDIGHIENGEYIVDSTGSFNSGTNWGGWLYSGNDKYRVYRITGHIKYLCNITITNSNTGVTLNYRQQPMLERIAYIPQLVSLVDGSYGWGTWSLQRDRIGNKDGSKLTNMGYAYYGCVNLKSLDLSEFYVTSKCTNLSQTFSECYNLTELDIANWDVSKVTNFSYMFTQCKQLKSLDLRTWDTSSATNISYMFYQCYGLKQILGLENFNTSKISGSNLNGIFANCFSIEDLSGVKNFVVDNVTQLVSIFSGCEKIKKLDLSSWNVSKVTTLENIFNGCKNLKQLNITGWTPGALTSVSNAFNSCHSLQNIDISNWNVTNACTSIYCLFYNCWSVKELNIPPTWDVSGLSNGSSVSSNVFAYCYNLEKITGIKNWNFQTTSSNGLAYMFNGCYSLKELDVSNWNVSTITSFYNMFNGCRSLKHLNLSNWTINNATTMESMFANCQSLEDITGNIGSWNTSNVTSFSTMFRYCWSLKELPDLSNWDVSSATNMANMFNECTKLEEITAKNWTLTNCTTIATMFRYCYNLRKADLRGWSMPKVTSTAPAQFLGDCWRLQDVDMVFVPLNYSFANDRSLTHETVVKILNALPQTSTTRTLNLTATNLNRLTAEEKAIATNKGWTLAA